MSKLRGLLAELPPEALVPVAWVVEHLEGEPEAETVTDLESWQERIWTVPEETRLSAQDVAELVGRSVGWVYKRTCETATERLPYRKVNGGALVFLAGELREWMRAREAA